MKYRLAALWDEWERVNGRRLTYREITQATGVSNTLLQRILAGENVTVETLQKLATFFGVQVRD